MLRRSRWLAVPAILIALALLVKFAVPSLYMRPASAAVNPRLTQTIWRDAGARLQPYLVNAGFRSMPDRLALLGFKDEKQLEVWGQRGGQWHFIRSYPILAASGIAGPKLRDGDRQVPEGLYSIALEQPKSSSFLALNIAYPNAADQDRAARDGRSRLGGPLCIHGWEVAPGALAVGNVAVEELYLLVSKVGPARTQLILAPNDLRTERPLLQGGPAVSWLPELYAELAQALAPFRPAPQEPTGQARPARGPL